MQHRVHIHIVQYAGDMTIRGKRPDCNTEKPQRGSIRRRVVSLEMFARQPVELANPRLNFIDDYDNMHSFA